MFFLGILAVFQILFIPGLIFRSLYHPKGKLFFQLSVIVTTSMLANFLLFFPMVYLHFYTRTAVLIVIGLEILVLLWLYRSIFRINLDEMAQWLNPFIREIKESISVWFASEKISPVIRLLRGLVIAVFLALSLSLAYWFFRRLPNNFGTVFNLWDSVVSWNAWAQDWAQGIVPNLKATYPQLLPINLSITYVLIGNFEVSLFAKAIMPIFALLTVLTVLEMAFSEKKYGYLIAVVLVYLLYKKFLGEYIVDGYADIPVAFMVLTALVPYFRNENIISENKEFILSMVLAAAASLTKQVGLYILAFLPLIALLNSKERSKKTIRFCLIALAVGTVLVLPWYLPLGISLLQGVKDSGLSVYLSLSSGATENSSLLLRPVAAMVSLGKYMFVYAFSLIAIPLLSRRWRWLIILFLIPFSLLWSIVASYDTRNLSMTFPVLAVIAGLAVQVCLDWGWEELSRIKIGKLSAAVLLLFVIAPIVYYGLKLDDKTLVAKWRDAQSQIFSPGINEQLYALDFSQDDCEYIMTNYPVRFLPDMQNRQRVSNFSDFVQYQNWSADPSICWMLVPGNSAANEVEEDIDAKLRDGTYTLLYETDNWVPYELIKVR